MGFTSVIFLFLFVPVSIILYYLMIMLEKIRILKKDEDKRHCISVNKYFLLWLGRFGWSKVHICLCSWGIYNGKTNWIGQKEKVYKIWSPFYRNFCTGWIAVLL